MQFPNRRATRPGTTRRVRLRDYDYSTPGYYFITICSHNQNAYFGSIRNRTMSFTPPGSMIGSLIPELECEFHTVTIDSFVIMPNHIHILIGLAVRLSDTPHLENLHDVVHWLKSTAHRRFRSGVESSGWAPYQGRVWQEGFNDHIVRRELELDILRNYISTNIERWEKDAYFLDETTIKPE